MFSVLLRGFVFGLAIAASPGPVFFLCLRRSLVQGRLIGLLSGLGVATVDGFYAGVATLGIAALLATLAADRRPIEVVGAVMLAAVGVSVALLRPPTTEGAGQFGARGLAWAYFSTVGLTLANPATVLSFVALAAGLARSTPALIVPGVLLGSATWWTVLAYAASWLRPRLSRRVVRGISIASGLAIVALALVALYTAVA